MPSLTHYYHPHKIVKTFPDGYNRNFVSSNKLSFCPQSDQFSGFTHCTLPTSGAETQEGCLGPLNSLPTITKPNCQRGLPGYRSLATVGFCHLPYLTTNLESISLTAFLLYLLLLPISPQSLGEVCPWSCLLCLSLPIQKKSCW